jgi:hypothetical protein
MDSPKEGHFELIQSIRVEPNEKHQDDRHQPSNLRHRVEYLIKSSEVDKFFISQLKNCSKKCILRIAVRLC